MALIEGFRVVAFVLTDLMRCLLKLFGRYRLGHSYCSGLLILEAKHPRAVLLVDNFCFREVFVWVVDVKI